MNHKLCIGRPRRFFCRTAAATLLAGVCAFALSVQAGSPAARKNGTPTKNLSVSHDEQTEVNIRERTAVLRSERVEKMPYLDKSFIRAAVQEQSVSDRDLFSSGGPRSLDDIIQRAIRVYLPAKVAHEKIELAHRRILVALRGLFPKAQLEMNHQIGSLSGSGFNRRNNILHFSQPVFHGGILWNTLLKERAALKQAAREQDKAVGDLIRDVSAAYFEYQRALMAAEERKQLLKNTEKYVDISKKKWEAQLISEIENLNVESSHNQMEYDSQTAQQELALARLELQKFLDLGIADSIEIKKLYQAEDFLKSGGKPPEAAKSVKAKSAQPLPAKTPPAVATAQKPAASGVQAGDAAIPAVEDLVDLAYRNRPELQAAASGLRVARLEEKIQWGGFLPEVDFLVDYGRNGEAFNDVTNHPSLRTLYKIGVEFKWNVAGNKTEYTFGNDLTAPSVSTFQGGSGSQTTGNSAKFGLLDGLDVFVNTKDAEVKRLEQVVALDDAEREVVKSVKEAFFEYQRSTIQLRAGIQKLNYRERLLALSKHRLGKNEVEVSEYMQAEQDFINQKIDLHKTIADYFTARAKLNRAVGRQDFMPLERIALS